MARRADTDVTLEGAKCVRQVSTPVELHSKQYRETDVEIKDDTRRANSLRLFDLQRSPCGKTLSVYSVLSVKEVIQPQVPLRLPCYDFAPVMTLAFGSLVPCGFRH
jgi:hypothetical protein